MNSQQSLDKILNELNFSDKEKEGFNSAILVAQTYLKDGNVDMEKQFQDIVEKVVADEV